VLNRFYESAKSLSADIIVRVTGDCPLVDSALVDECIKSYKNSNVDYFSNVDPAPAKDYNLMTMVDMKKNFRVLTGLSDHTIGNTTAIASIALGASIIEKHVTLDRNGGGPDDSFSLEYQDLKELCADVRTVYNSLGKVDYGAKSSERGNVKFRRSLYFVKGIKAGQIITEGHVKSIRPGFGLAPKNITEIVGRRVKEDIEPGTAVDWNMLKEDY
jgi:sialic acid synthase SpsE